MVWTSPPTTSVGQLINAAFLNLYLRDNLNYLNGAGAVPTGLIALWGSTIASIPSGWALNDNAGGSIVDLRDKFVVGAGTTYAVGASGGALTGTSSAHSDHSVNQPSHSAHVVTQPDTHTMSTNAATPQISRIIAGTHSGADVTGSHTHANAAISTGGHTHDTVSILPPYHARTFMQKSAPGTSFTSPRTWADAEVNTAAQFNADLRDNFTHLNSLACAQNTIIMWGGSIASLPGGWLLCNGSNGTPDLRDKFVVGAGSTYAVAATGGAVSAGFAAHSSHTPTQSDAHSNHTVTQPTAHATGSIQFPGDTAYSGNNHVGADINAHSAHSGFAVDAHAAHSSFSVLPTYYALALIMLASGSSYTSAKTWSTSEIVQSSEFNTYLRDNLLAIYNGQFPIGGIAIWYSSTGTIPSGYQLCNGTNGTPELRDKFIIGAGSTYAVGGTGGSTSVTPGAHSDHAVTQPSTHSAHSATQPTAHTGASDTGAGGAATAKLYSGTHTSFGVDAHSAHAFTVSAHSAHSSVAVLPPYWALCYIQRLT